MIRRAVPLLIAILLLLAPLPSRTQVSVGNFTSPLMATFDRVLTIIEPPDPDAPAQTFTGKFVVTKADGLPRDVKDAVIEVAYQFPERLLINAKVRGETYIIGRDGQELWIHVPSKKFALIGVNGLPRFSADPSSIDKTTLPQFSLGGEGGKIRLFAFALTSDQKEPETLGGVNCTVLAASMPEVIRDFLKLPEANVELAIRDMDQIPSRLRFNDGKQVNLELVLENPVISEPWPAEKWKIKPNDGDKAERVALSHLTNFITVAVKMLDNKIPTLGEVTGERKLVSTSGKGRLETWDGTRVLFLSGTPEEMGKQQGTLLKKEVKDVTRRILYGVGVGSSFPKGKWFFGEIEAAHARLSPYISQRYYQEIDALADASGVSKQEIRLANFFPELFHCSGFAVAGDATIGGRIYHGRILDYLKGVGLEQNAVVTLHDPHDGHAWVNIGYAGFIGTVTAMNEKHISIGEMGGRGEGNWDGKPMAQLLREVMENADSLDEAVEIMRNSKRTCEYYYVVADGRSKKAVGIKATPDLFETVTMGASHPQLPDPVKDTVLLSAGDRYKKLVERVKENYGKLDATSARALMEKPVCMSSNIHSVLFAPDTLDFWVANADSQNVASHARYTKYNLRELLTAEPAKK